MNAKGAFGEQLAGFEESRVFLLSGSAVVHSKHWNELLHELTFNRPIGQRATP